MRSLWFQVAEQEKIACLMYAHLLIKVAYVKFLFKGLQIHASSLDIGFLIMYRPKAIDTQSRIDFINIKEFVTV